ncbi:cilia- and flagella-associated protein 52 isoform X1 [Stegostoma tigrinum]|uniref:cilia- and flagella-associated protein 52 isoform X1 n=1 Tax=Stegostoma tigrinum TaxID=3053191 RepID=UPI00202AD4A4|nr:cilia- and flagella-associated protein 52 isoform X1 [Stegostoma tigrinum]
MAKETEDFSQLELESIIGFNGKVPSGLTVHPDCENIIYPLGCTAVVQNLKTSQQAFLESHTNNISFLAVSRSGRYIATGQVTYMGFKADIIIYDYVEKITHATMTLHQAKVEALAFSPNDLYLVSLGGQDDGSVVIWNIATKSSICGSPACVPTAGNAFSVRFANNMDDTFITGGTGTLRLWLLDLPNRKIRPTECQTGPLKRMINCIEVAKDDSFFYCGTTSGDILMISMKTGLLNNYGPIKNKFSLGVTAIVELKSEDVLVGTGDGLIVLCKAPHFKALKKVQVDGGITSISLRGQGHQFFLGTITSQIYRFNFTEFKEDLITTCHCDAVLDIAFPCGTSDLFGTCSKAEIRIWHTPTNKELLRISVPNMTCNAIEFMRDGKSIISAWNDGKIRAFTPETGRLMYTINNAHHDGVTAIAATSDCKKIISGGGEGQIRIWEIFPKSQKFTAGLKEHTSTVSCIKIKKNDQECVTASYDGTCIIWDIIRYARNQMILANTLFKCVCYHPEEYQVITSGKDRKIGYWEVYDGSAIRELDGSLSGSVNGMDITMNGDFFVTGGEDKLIKFWGYNEGEVIYIGIGHSGTVNRIKISPSVKHIISVSSDGAILRWKYPYTN